MFFAVQVNCFVQWMFRSGQEWISQQHQENRLVVNMTSAAGDQLAKISVKIINWYFKPCIQIDHMTYAGSTTYIDSYVMKAERQFHLVPEVDLDGS